MAAFLPGIVCLLWVHFVHGSSLDGVILDLPEAQLQRKLVSAYPMARPVRNNSDTLHVKVELHPLCLKELNVAKQELSLVAGLTMSWMNEFLAWNPKEYDHIQATYVPASANWKPLFQISNSVTDTANNEDASQSQYILVNSNGSMRWSMSRKFQTYCNVDVFYFPFDTQNCCITLTNWLSGSDYTKFFPGPLDDSIFIESTEWTVLKKEANAQLLDLGAHYEFNISQVSFCLILQRRSSYYVITIIMPLFLLSFVGLMVFPLPPASGEKISLCVACLMSFSITQVAISAHLPTSWHSVPIIMILNICFMTLNVLSVCVTVLNLHIHLKEEHGNKTGLSLMDLLPFNWKCNVFSKGTGSIRNSSGTDATEIGKGSEKVNQDSTPLQSYPYDVSVHQDSTKKPTKLETVGKEALVQRKWKDQAILLNTCLSYVFVSIFLLLLTISGIMWLQHYQSEW